ncbi:MAG: glycosyltransferase family 39 protein [Actinomycetota bacterium]|nr:glycosyltransferase family 39 protein [Actinomycetota bacterium]
MEKETEFRRIASLASRENLPLALILIGSFLLRAYRMGEAFGGFHGFNEAFYTLYAQKYLARPIYALLTEATDFNNPPLFSYLLFLSFKLFGVSEASARLVPIVFAVLATYFTYLVAVKLYGRRVGLLSAMLVAFNPAFVIVGRNVQIDIVFVCFILIALYYYLKSKEAADLKNKCLAGLFLGLGILAKQPAILLLGIIVLWEISRDWNFTWFKKSFLCFALIPFLLPLSWFIYHLIANPKRLITEQTIRAGSIRPPNLLFFQKYFIGESFWMFSPLVFVLVVLGIGLLLYRRNHSDKLILLTLAVYTSFYFFFHQHTYYLLPIVPFACIAGATLIDSMKSRLIFVFVLSIPLITSVFYSVLLLAGHKYGYNHFKNLAMVVEKEAGTKSAAILITDTFDAEYGPLVEYYLPWAKVTTKEDVVFGKGKKVYFLAPWWVLNLDPSSLGVQNISRTMYLPTAFGYVFYQAPSSDHYFAQGKLKVVKVGAFTDFGFTRVKVPFLTLVDLDKYKRSIEASNR